MKKAIEHAKGANESLKVSNEVLKADNIKMEKKLKEAEKMAKAVDQAERFKNSVLEFFQNKYEDADNKKRPDTTVAEFMPKSLQKYFTSQELEYCIM